MDDKPMNNDERHFLINIKTLQLYSKLTFISDYFNSVCNGGGTTISPDAAAGLSDILYESTCGLLQIKEWNEEVAKNTGLSDTASDSGV